MATVYIKPEDITQDQTISIPNTSGALVPPGSLLMFAGATPPTGYLICDGSEINRSDYAVLFTAIGTAYGAGDGETTFNIPDLRGRGPIGAGSGGGLTTRELGDVGGTETVTLDTTMIPSHTHTGTVDSNGAHTHTGTTDAGGSHTHTSNAIGGQGNYGLAVADGSNTATATDGSAGELNVWTVPAALTINASSTHTHTFTSASNGAHTHTFTSGSTGGGQAHPNMTPFLGVNFIIKT